MASVGSDGVRARTGSETSEQELFMFGTGGGDRAQLRERLNGANYRVVCTFIHKFVQEPGDALPCLHC